MTPEPRFNKKFRGQDLVTAQQWATLRVTVEYGMYIGGINIGKRAYHPPALATECTRHDVSDFT